MWSPDVTHYVAFFVSSFLRTLRTIMKGSSSLEFSYKAAETIVKFQANIGHLMHFKYYITTHKATYH